LEKIAVRGLETLPELIRIMVNEAMKLEREQHLGARPYERTPTRRVRERVQACSYIPERPLAVLCPEDWAC